MQRKLLGTVAVAVLLVTAGCLGALTTDASGGAAAQAAPADGQAQNSTIEVSATGDATAEADQAVVRVAVETRGDDAETARQRLAENVSELRDGLREVNVSDDQITTSGYDIREDYRRGPEQTDADPTYMARQSFEITLADTGRAGTVIDAAVGSGASRVDDVRFTLTDERQDELKTQALEEAMDTARARADTLAGKADLSVTGVQQVSTRDVNHGPVRLETTAAAGDAGGGTSIDGGPVRVSADVHVVYEAE